MERAGSFYQQSPHGDPYLHFLLPESRYRLRRGYCEETPAPLGIKSFLDSGRGVLRFMNSYAYAVGPPCTERYARWCERSVTQRMDGSAARSGGLHGRDDASFIPAEIVCGLIHGDDVFHRGVVLNQVGGRHHVAAALVRHPAGVKAIDRVDFSSKAVIRASWAQTSRKTGRRWKGCGKSADRQLLRLPFHVPAWKRCGTASGRA